MVEGAHFANWRFWTHLCLDLGGWHGQLPHSYQAVSRSRECEHPTHFVNSPMPNLALDDGLRPPEALFDPLPLLLANGIASVPRGPLIYGAATAPVCVFCATCGVTC